MELISVCTHACRSVAVKLITQTMGAFQIQFHGLCFKTNSGLIWQAQMTTFIHTSACRWRIRIEVKRTHDSKYMYSTSTSPGFSSSSFILHVYHIIFFSTSLFFSFFFLLVHLILISLSSLSSSTSTFSDTLFSYEPLHFTCLYFETTVDHLPPPLPTLCRLSCLMSSFTSSVNLPWSLFSLPPTWVHPLHYPLSNTFTVSPPP